MLDISLEIYSKIVCLLSWFVSLKNTNYAAFSKNHTPGFFVLVKVQYYSRSLKNIAIFES